MILPPGRKSKHPAAGPKGGFELIFHIAVCSPDSVLRSRVERQCLDYYARRDDACIVEQLDGPEALLARDDAGERYELYLIELPSTAAAASLRAAAASMSMAYSKAWSIIRAAEQGFGCKLLHSTIGGSGGGGAELTDEARQIMAAYETYCARLNEYGQALFGELFPFCARENHIDSTRK